MFLVTALFFSKFHVGAAPQSKLTPAEISHHQKHQIAARYINTMLLVVSFFSSVKKDNDGSTAAISTAASVTRSMFSIFKGKIYTDYFTNLPKLFPLISRRKCQ